MPIAKRKLRARLVYKYRVFTEKLILQHINDCIFAQIRDSSLIVAQCTLFTVSVYFLSMQEFFE
jgi:hypothetical protein